MKGSLDIQSGFLDLSPYIHVKDPASEKREKNGTVPLFNRAHLRMVYFAEKGQWKTLELGPIKVKANMKSGTWDFEKAYVVTEYGLLSGKGRIVTGKDSALSFDSRLEIKNEPVEEILKLFGLEEERFEGPMFLSAELSAYANKDISLFQSLTGKGRFYIEKGKIEKSSAFIKALEFLSLQKIKWKKPENMSKGGLFFEAAGADFTLEQGILKTDDFIMKSPAFNAAAKGYMDLSKETMDFDLGIQPLGTVDGVVSKIPLIGVILAGEEKSVLIYNFKATGQIEEPQVKYVPAIHKSTFNVFKRLLLTPNRLLQNLSTVAKDPGKDYVEVLEEEF
jgi:uncharacterized protein YhdP